MCASLQRTLLPACAVSVLILLGAARCLAEPPAVKKALEGFEKLNHVVTVRCGTTPVTDEKARKLVRVVTSDGCGYARVLVALGSRSRSGDMFRTDEDGLAEVKTTKGDSLVVFAGSVHVCLSPEAMRFPVEVVLARGDFARPSLGEKKQAPKGFENLRQLLTAKTGHIPIRVKDVRKLVRVVDQDGRGVKDALIETMMVSSREKKPVRTDKDGLAEIKGFATFMRIDAGQAQLRLVTNPIMKFPIEVTVSRDEKNRKAAVPRDGAGWSQSELAERAGMHSNSLARLECGEYEPGWPLALALGVSVALFDPYDPANAAHRARER